MSWHSFVSAYVGGLLARSNCNNNSNQQQLSISLFLYLLWRNHCLFGMWNFLVLVVGEFLLVHYFQICEFSLCTEKCGRFFPKDVLSLLLNVSITL